MPSLRAMVEQELEDAGDVARAMQIILEDLRHSVPFDSASVQELRGGRLVIVGGIGFADLDVIIGESFDVDNADSPNGEVVHRRRAIIVPDTETYRAFRRGLHVGVGIRSWLGIPLFHRGELIGMIALDKAEADFYTEEHRQIAVDYAPRVATAMAERIRA